MKSSFRKVILTASVLAMATPQLVGAQSSAPTAAEEARAAELMCEVVNICGDEAVAEDSRTKESQGGKTTRAMMSIGSVKAAMPTQGASEDVISTTRNVVRQPVQALNTNGELLAASTVRSAAVLAPRKTQTASESRGQLMVNFALGSAQLTDDSMFEIRSFVLGVKNLDERGIRKSFRIEGHADSSGTESINVPLSTERAKAVRDLIVSSGIEDGRIEYAGYGSSMPLPSVPASSSLNRRVKAVLVE